MQRFDWLRALVHSPQSQRGLVACEYLHEYLWLVLTVTVNQVQGGNGPENNDEAQLREDDRSVTYEI